MEALSDFKNLFLALHIGGILIGLGGATGADLLFFRSIRKSYVTKEEAIRLSRVSRIIWIGIVILLISGLALYLPSAETLNNSPKFLVKVIVVAVIIVNGIALNVLIAPNLSKFTFKGNISDKKMRLRRHLAFALGAVSVSSWYSALILGLLQNPPLKFLPLLGMYFGVLCIAIIASQVLEYVISAKRI